MEAAEHLLAQDGCLSVPSSSAAGAALCGPERDSGCNMILCLLAY